MTETLTGKQVLALLAQDEVSEIEFFRDDEWHIFVASYWAVNELLDGGCKFRIKPKPARRLSVTLANGEMVSWPEPVREALKEETEYWFVDSDGAVDKLWWTDHQIDKEQRAFGNVHLTREAAQEHADALRKINTQGATC